MGMEIWGLWSGNGNGNLRFVEREWILIDLEDMLRRAYILVREQNLGFAWSENGSWYIWKACLLGDTLVRESELFEMICQFRRDGIHSGYNINSTKAKRIQRSTGNRWVSDQH